MTGKFRMFATTLVALGSLGMGAGTAAAAPPQVPLVGSYAGTLAFTGPSTAALSGTGSATLLGAGANQGQVALIGPASSCPGGLVALNTETLVAANGDTVTITINDVSCPVSPGVYHGSGQYVVTGGTGRFAGATGQGAFRGVGDFNQDQFSFQLDGTISAPGGN